uniref:Transcriptional regulator ATRX homolog n=1 Tax=Cacopsylla melanoneura TaxID=428564 RepID=A0A8D9AVG2_9HEMI
MKSESEMETKEKDKSGKNDSKRKEKRKSSCKEETQSEEEKKEADSGTDEDDEKKNESGKESREKKRRNSSVSNSVAKLTGLSSLEKPSSSKSDTPKSKTKKKEDSDTPKSKSKKKVCSSLLEFLNEDDSSSAAEELEESTELLSSLIKAKSEEAKKQNEEMIKQALLRADDESNKDENSSAVESDNGVVSDDKKETSKKIKKEESEKKSKKKPKDSSSDSDDKSKKKKKGDGWRNDPLLKGKLSDTDTSEGEKKFEAKLKKEGKEATITLSSDDELFAKKKPAKKESSGDDSDCFVIKKKKLNKRRGRLRDSSDSSDVLVISSSDDSSESSDDDFKKKKDAKKKKRSRIKKMKDSDESGSDSDVEELNASQGTPGKGRKNIRHILTNEELAAKTINASKAEEERKKRIEERQARYNKLFKPPDDPHEKLTKLVLDFDEKTSTELISVHPDLVGKLKPHQVEGVRFMFNACFESVHQIKKNKKGSGCILAHCMGLGKTLQVVTLVHTLMTHQDVTKVERVMVVTPLNTVSNWVDEFHNWLKKINNGDDVETFNLIKAKKDYERSYTLNCWFEEGGVLIIGYEMFRNLLNKRGLSKKVKTIIQKTLVDPGPDLVVCDEGHILKNEASAVSKAMSQIRSLRRIILTGTPLQNNLEEYHCMVQFVKPNLLGDRKEFKNRFANPINNGQYIDSTPRDVKIMKRRAHVLYKMLDGIVQRKDYNVLTPFLPPKYEYVISIKLTELQIKLYSHYLQTNVSPEDSKPRLFADYQTLKLVWTHPYALKSASLTRQKREDAKEAATDSEGSLRDFIDDDDDDEEEKNGSESGSGSNSPPPAKKTKTRAATRAAKESGEVVSEEEKEDNKEPAFWWTSLVTEDDIHNLTNSNKLLAFMFVLKQCEEIGDKLLVFSQSLETLSLLEYFLNKIDECSQDGTLDPNLSQFQASWTLGLDYFRLDGSSSSEDRAYWVKSFNNPSNLRARLFLISTKAGGLGINLVSANRVIIFDVSWNPSHDIQSIFRVFRFGQTKPCYIYRFLAQGTMEEKIYDRQVAKQSMSCRVVDEQQIDRHFTRSDITELYEFKPDEKKDRKTPALPKDRLMAEMIKEMGEKIVCFHEHDSLLENVQDEELNEDERKAAWEEFESEKSRPAISAGATYVNNLIMQNNIRQQQAGMMGGGAANLTLDSQQMLNFLKNSNPDVSEEALIKIVDQNAQRLEDYKKKQESYFHSMINNMHQNLSNAAGRGLPNMPVPGGLFPRLPNQIGMGPRGPIMGTNQMGMGPWGTNPMGGIGPRGAMPARPLRGTVPGAMPARPGILKSNARTVPPPNIAKRMGPASSKGGVRPPIPLPPGGPDAPGSSSSKPIEI